MRRYAREVVHVPMPDAGVTRDVDTPADSSFASLISRPSRILARRP